MLKMTTSLKHVIAIPTTKSCNVATPPYFDVTLKVAVQKPDIHSARVPCKTPAYASLQELVSEDLKNLVSLVLPHTDYGTSKVHYSNRIVSRFAEWLAIF